MYTMTKDGFVFLIMGFTGKKAAAFKEAYIAEFNRMEAELYSIPKYKPQAAELFYNNDIDRLTRIVWEMMQRLPLRPGLEQRHLARIAPRSRRTIPSAL